LEEGCEKSVVLKLNGVFDKFGQVQPPPLWASVPTLHTSPIPTQESWDTPPSPLDGERYLWKTKERRGDPVFPDYRFKGFLQNNL